MEHLYDKLQSYAMDDYYPYHMPGHKRRVNGNMPCDAIRMDITEIDGFDNLHQPEGILRRLQEKAATLYGAEESFYLVNGSTGGILSAISAALPKGGHILMARNCHKSAYHAIYLRNLTVSYLFPSMMEEYDISDAITPKQVAEALEEKSDIGAVLLVSPTYEGRIADVRKIAEIVHERGIPLIIDEAHGAHLGWHEKYGPNSCQAGADIVIHSVHKTLPAMTQTALLHVNGSIIDRDRLRRFLHIYQTSSPSYILMASIDNALHFMEDVGYERMEFFSEQYSRMMDRLTECKCLEFLPMEKGKQDIGKLIISSKRFGMSGQKLYNILLEKYHLQMEMAAGNYCLAMFTVGDDVEGYKRMTEALLEIDRQMQQGTIQTDHLAKDIPQFMPGTDCSSIPFALAWDREMEYVPLQKAVGRYVGEFINLYPPGVPLLVPGEVLTEDCYRQVSLYLEQGLIVQGVELAGNTHKIKCCCIP